MQNKLVPVFPCSGSYVNEFIILPYFFDALNIVFHNNSFKVPDEEDIATTTKDQVFVPGNWFCSQYFLQLTHCCKSDEPTRPRIDMKGIK